MKKDNKIAIILLIIAIPLLFGAVYSVYAKQKAETERVEFYNKVIKLDLSDETQEYLLNNKLLSDNDLDTYNELFNELMENEKAPLDELKGIEKDLNTYLDVINKDLNKKVNAKKKKSLKKVNKLKAKTKAEKNTKATIKKTLNKKYDTDKNNLRNINLLVEKHKSLEKQDSKIKSLAKKIKKRVTKETNQQQTNTIGTNYYTGTTPNYYNPKSNNNGGSSGGNNKSGGKDGWSQNPNMGDWGSENPNDSGGGYLDLNP